MKLKDQEDNPDYFYVNIARTFLYEQLLKQYPNCVLGSDHTDTSYINFSTSIRIDYKNQPIHIKTIVKMGNNGIILRDKVKVAAYTPPVERGKSFLHGSCSVDFFAPDFGDLLETIETYVKEIMVVIDEPLQTY